MLQLKDHPLTQADAGLDSTAYVDLADRVLAGDAGLGPGLYFLSPLYVYFLAVVLALGHSFAAVRLAQIVLGTAAVALVFVAAEAWFGRRAAWFAATLATLTGWFTFYESLLLQTALDPFLTAAAIALLALAFVRGERRWYALAGIAFGVHMCNRPNVALPAVVVAALLAATRRRSAAVFAIGVAIALAPVTIRNIVVSGYWSPVTSSHGGLNFYIGNNADADGTYRAVPGVTPDIKGQQEDTRRVAEQAAGRPLGDAEVSSFFYRRAFQWIRSQPWAAVRLFARKISLTFSAAYVWLNYSYPFFAEDPRTLLGVLVVGPWLLVPLGLVGAIAAAPAAHRSAYLVWASCIPAYALSVAAFFVADRYQLVMLVPLCVCAGAALDVFVHWMAARRWAPLTVSAAALVALSAWVNRPLHLDDGVVEERTRMAERMVTLGRYEEAERWVERAARGSPRPGVVHFRVGQQLVAHDRPASAIAHFRTALEHDPGQPVAEYALGETLLEAERAAEAIGPLRRALAAGVHVDQAGFDLVRALGAAGDRPAAVDVLRGVRPARDDDADRWVALGELALQLREPALAETFARKAISVRPRLSAAQRLLGIDLNTQGRWAEAAGVLEEAVRLDPRDPAARIALSVADANIGRLPDARREVEEALRLDPRSERARQLRRALAR